MKVEKIKRLSAKDFESLKSILGSQGLHYAAGGMSTLKNVANITVLYLVQRGDGEWHNWSIIHVATKDKEKAIKLINKGKFEFIVNQIPGTERIDRWISNLKDKT